MGNSMTETLQFPSAVCSDVLTEVLRAGAQQLLAQAVQIEAEQWIATRADQVDGQGRRQVVRNGYLPQRQVLTGIGPIPVRQPPLKIVVRRGSGTYSTGRLCRPIYGEPRAWMKQLRGCTCTGSAPTTWPNRWKPCGDRWRRVCRR